MGYVSLYVCAIRREDEMNEMMAAQMKGSCEEVGGANLGTFLCLREWDEYREKYTTVRLKVAVLLSNSIALFIKGNPSLLYVQLFL